MPRFVRSPEPSSLSALTLDAPDRLGGRLTPTADERAALAAASPATVAAWLAEVPLHLDHHARLWARRAAVARFATLSVDVLDALFPDGADLSLTTGVEAVTWEALRQNASSVRATAALWRTAVRCLPRYQDHPRGWKPSLACVETLRRVRRHREAAPLDEATLSAVVTFVDHRLRVHANSHAFQAASLLAWAPGLDAQALTRLLPLFARRSAAFGALLESPMLTRELVATLFEQHADNDLTRYLVSAVVKHPTFRMDPTLQDRVLAARVLPTYWTTLEPVLDAPRRTRMVERLLTARRTGVKAAIALLTQPAIAAQLGSLEPTLLARALGAADPAVRTALITALGTLTFHSAGAAAEATPEPSPPARPAPERPAPAEPPDRLTPRRRRP